MRPFGAFGTHKITEHMGVGSEKHEETDKLMTIPRKIDGQESQNYAEETVVAEDVVIVGEPVQFVRGPFGQNLDGGSEAVDIWGDAGQSDEGSLTTLQAWSSVGNDPGD